MNIKVLMSTAIILAGGRGTRLRPLTDNTPKPLLRTPCQPLLEHQIETLYESGIHSVYVLIHVSQYTAYKACIDTLDMKYCMRVVLVTESDWLGTAGSIVNCLWSHPELSQLPYILVMNGDIVCRQSISSLFKTYKENNCACLLTHFTTKDPSQYGVMHLSKCKEHKLSSASNPSFSDGGEELSLAVSSLSSTSLDSLPKCDKLISSASSASSLHDDFAENSVESEITIYAPYIDARQITRIEEYTRIHKNSSSISKMPTPHPPSSPAGLRCNRRSSKSLSQSSSLSCTGSLQTSFSKSQTVLIGLTGRCTHTERSLMQRNSQRNSSKNFTTRGVTKLGHLISFSEKPRKVMKDDTNVRSDNLKLSKAYYANAGIYVLNPTLLLSFSIPCSMELDVFPTLLERKVTILSTYIGPEDTWSDMGTISGFIKGCQLIHGIQAFETERVIWQPSVTATQAKDTAVRTDGKGNVICSSAHVSSRANITNCVIYNNATVPAGTYLNGCIVYQDVNIAPGKSYYNRILI